MEREFKKDIIVKHFKRELCSSEELKKNPFMYMYKIVCKATHTETMEEVMVYQALYGDNRCFVRPYEMFCAKVDRNKYPNIKQENRLEIMDLTLEDILKAKEVNAKVEELAKQMVDEPIVDIEQF